MTDNSTVIIVTHVRVRELSILADVGINPDEIGRRQPLIVSIDLAVETEQDLTKISQTVDYRRIVGAVEDLAGAHVSLIEMFGDKLCRTFLGWRNVQSVKVAIDKPFALNRGIAGVEISARRFGDRRLVVSDMIDTETMQEAARYCTAPISEMGHDT